MPTRRNWSLPHSDLLLDVRGLGKTVLLHERSTTVTCVDSVSFAVGEGECVVLAGPSGAGKSSVLKCIHRTYRPTAGDLLFRQLDGSLVDLSTAPDNEVIALRERDIGLVTQFLEPQPRRTVLDIVAKPLTRSGQAEDEARRTASQLLDHLRVSRALHDLSPATLSGGERQRINIARRLIVRHRLLLLDEPTASLDTASRDVVMALFEAEKRAGTAIVAVLHDPELIEQLADRVIMITPSDAQREGALA